MKFRLRNLNISESLVDQVITNAGGYRIADRHTFSPGVKNCDYRCDDIFIELKFLEREAIESPERQKKLAALFEALLVSHPEFRDTVDISKLPPNFKRKYWDIYLRGLKKAVESANRQIRETAQSLGLQEWRGAIFVINKECESVDPETVWRYIEHLMAKQFSSLQYVISFTAIPGVMAGHDRQVLEYYNTPPSRPDDQATLQRIHDSFRQKIQECLGKPIPMSQAPHGSVKNLRTDKNFQVGDAHISLKTETLQAVPAVVLPKSGGKR